FFLSLDLIALILSVDHIRCRHLIFLYPISISIFPSILSRSLIHRHVFTLYLPYVLHAVTMWDFTYIPSYLVVLSLASYCLFCLNPTALLESLARPKDNTSFTCIL